MLTRLLMLHHVIEVRPRLLHRHRADRLSHHHHQQSHPQQHLSRGGGYPMPSWKEQIGEETLHHRGRMRDLVRRPVLAEQKAGHRGGTRVVRCGGPELEEVEGGEGGDEEGEAPEG